MTLNELTAALNAADEMTGTDYAGYFDISRDEAERIAAKCETVADFLRIWQDETWWTDGAAA